MKSNNLKVTNVQRLSMDYYTLLKRDYHYLVHAWNCRDFNCCSEGCAKMKNLILHSYECKKQECQLCKSTLILCYHHVWVCKHDLTCNLPFCSNLWQKMILQIKFQEAVKDINGFTNCNLLQKDLQFNSKEHNVGRKRKFPKKQTLTYVSIVFEKSVCQSPSDNSNSSFLEQ